MANVTPEIASLRRKHAATKEPAKRAELASLLRARGFDPDASEPVSVAPKGRKAPERVTAEQDKPTVTAGVTSKLLSGEGEDKETAKNSAAKAKPAARRPGRPSKSETSK